MHSHTLQSVLSCLNFLLASCINHLYFDDYKVNPPVFTVFRQYPDPICKMFWCIQLSNEIVSAYVQPTDAILVPVCHFISFCVTKLSVTLISLITLFHMAMDSINVILIPRTFIAFSFCSYTMCYILFTVTISFFFFYIRCQEPCIEEPSHLEFYVGVLICIYFCSLAWWQLCRDVGVISMVMDLIFTYIYLIFVILFTLLLMISSSSLPSL